MKQQSGPPGPLCCLHRSQSPRSLHGTHLGGPLTYSNSHLGCKKQPFRNNKPKCAHRPLIFATYQRIELCCTTALIPNTRRLKNTSPPFKNGFRKKAAPYTKYATKLKSLSWKAIAFA